jgi:hypothetical protein
MEKLCKNTIPAIRKRKYRVKEGEEGRYREPETWRHDNDTSPQGGQRGRHRGDGKPLTLEE